MNPREEIAHLTEVLELAHAPGRRRGAEQV